MGLSRDVFGLEEKQDMAKVLYKNVPNIKSYLHLNKSVLINRKNNPRAQTNKLRGTTSSSLENRGRENLTT